MKIRNLVCPIMDKFVAKGCFDGLSLLGRRHSYLDESHYINFKVGTGPSSNDYVEMMALKLLTKARNSQKSSKITNFW